jgi:hypothetical protein
MKVLVRIGLAFVGLAFVCATASAEPISSADAHAKCWAWTFNMDSKTSHCGFCEWFTMKPRCNFYVCDQTGCDTVTVERRAPRGKWSVGRASLVR